MKWPLVTLLTLTPFWTMIASRIVRRSLWMAGGEPTRAAVDRQLEVELVVAGGEPILRGGVFFLAVAGRLLALALPALDRVDLVDRSVRKSPPAGSVWVAVGCRTAPASARRGWPCATRRPPECRARRGAPCGSRSPAGGRAPLGTSVACTWLLIWPPALIAPSTCRGFERRGQVRTRDTGCGSLRSACGRPSCLYSPGSATPGSSVSPRAQISPRTRRQPMRPAPREAMCLTQQNSFLRGATCHASVRADPSSLLFCPVNHAIRPGVAGQRGVPTGPGRRPARRSWRPRRPAGR